MHYSTQFTHEDIFLFNYIKYNILYNTAHDKT